MYRYAWILILLCFNSCYFDNDAYLFQERVKEKNVEELAVTKVKSHKNFILESKVKQWKSLSVGPICYTAGYDDNKVFVITSTQNSTRDGLNIAHFSQDFQRSPSDVELLATWVNHTLKVALIVSFLEKPQITWWWIEHSTLVPFWSWNLENKRVVHLQAFRIGHTRMLAFIYNQSERAGLCLYEYKIDQNRNHLDYWFMRSISLKESANSMAINQEGKNFFISIPQANAGFVQIFKYQVDTKSFIQYQRIVSNNVRRVSSFYIIFRTFIAIDGQSAGIYEFLRSNIVRSNIANNDGIRYWLPVPVDTLRDEVILFADREVDHGTHLAHTVDIFIHNGIEFEEHEDVSCEHLGDTSLMLECISGEEGMLGSSYIVIENVMALIVPRPKEGKSVVFDVETAIKQAADPMIDELEYFRDVRRKIETIINETEVHLDLAKKHKALVDNRSKLKYETVLGSIKPENITHYSDIVRELSEEVENLVKRVNRVTEQESKNSYEKIIVNGIASFQGPTIIKEAELEVLNNAPATKLLNDIVRKDKVEGRLSNKTFISLTTDEINFQNVNGIRASDIMYVNDSNPTIKGNVIFEKPVQMGNAFVGEKQEPLLGAVQEIELIKETLHVPGNITVNFVNGINFTEFVHKLCLVNRKCYIPGNFTINGNINVGSANTFHLNDLKFPDEYIFNDEVSHANITGRKTFVNSVTVKEIRVEGEADGLNTNDIVTLSTDQYIPAKLTFKDLHLTKKLNVTGNISGELVDKFLPNPTLKDVSVIKANVNFKDVEVAGDIVIENSFNGEDFKHLLEDVIYEDTPSSINVTGLKEFREPITILGNLDITTNSVNHINLTSLVTKDSDQDFSLNRLNGDVAIRKLIVHGTYDSQNITKLDEELVKLTGDQYIASTLIFLDDIDVDNLKMENLNDVPADGYFFTTSFNEIDHSVHFKNIKVENLEVLGIVEGVAVDERLEGLETRYLSLTMNQSITGGYYIKLCNIDSLESEEANMSNMLFNKNYTDWILKRLNNYSLEVEELIFEEPVQVNAVNDRPMKGTYYSQIRKARENLVVDADVYFDDIDINWFGNKNWTKLIQLFVFKNETDINLGGVKTFTNGFTVEKLLETIKLNGVLLENILTKEGVQEVKGDVALTGVASFSDVIVGDHRGVLSKLKVENGSFFFEGDVLFSRLPHIRNLTLYGSINNKDFKKELSRTASITADFIDADTIAVFKRPVKISGNVTLGGNLNDVPFSDTVDSIVTLNGNTNVQSTVIFTKPVIISDSLIIDHNLKTKKLMNLDLDELQKKAVFLDKGFLSGNYTFEKITIQENLLTPLINDIDMSKVVPLVSNQSLEKLHFTDVTIIKNMDIVGTVNGKNLSEEFENTLMIDKLQEVPSLVFTNPVLVRKNLTTALINNKPASKIVTTDIDQELSAKYNFKSRVSVMSNVSVHGLMNDIDVKKWKDNDLRASKAKQLQFRGELNVAENLTFESNVDGANLLSGLDIFDLAMRVQEIKKNKYDHDQGIIDDYKGICTDIKYMSSMVAYQIYKFRYFEDLQEILFSYSIRHAFFFEYKNKVYLLVNQDNCFSHLFVFKETGFIHTNTVIETGDISQVINVRGTNGEHYLVTSGEKPRKFGKCRVNGTNGWEFKEDSLQLLFKLDDQIRLQESLVPFTFYGLNRNGVSEFVVRPKSNNYRIYRKWNVYDDNARFLPRGLQTGLTVFTEKKIIHLHRVRNQEHINDYDDSEIIIRGSFNEIVNNFITRQMKDDVIVTNVGMRESNTGLLVVTETDETGFDFVNIFSDPFEGKLIQRIATNKPSSLLSMEFGQGETLLVLLEDKKMLSVYEYKGIEGFKWKYSAQIPGTQLLQTSLPIQPRLEPTKTIGIVDGNRFKLIKSIMAGTRFKGDVECHL